MRSGQPILVYSGPVDAETVVREALRERLEIRWVPPEPDAVARGLECAAAFLDASMKVRITRKMVEASPRLRVVATATTGADHIDVEALAGRGIPLLTLKGQSELLANLTPAAEHSWLLVLACARRLAAARRHVLAGGWERTEFPGVMLRGKTLGIIGCGRIGRWMARYAEAFEMTCLGYDPYVGEWPVSIKRVGLHQLLAESDVVTLHVHLTEETRDLLGRAEFERMKRGAIVVNTSRGELIDEEALLDGLRSGWILAAGLDVLAGEPEIRNSPLWQYAQEHDNLLITPHIGGYSPDAVRIVVRFAAERIVEYFEGTP